MLYALSRIAHRSYKSNSLSPTALDPHKEVCYYDRMGKIFDETLGIFGDIQPNPKVEGELPSIHELEKKLDELYPKRSQKEIVGQPALTSRQVRDYWDTHLEHNELRAPKSGEGPETDAGAFLATKLENAGDILREMGKDYSDIGYMKEKFGRIKSVLKYRDWTDPLSATELRVLEKIKVDLANMPTADEPTVRVKGLLEAITDRNPGKIAKALDNLEPFVRKLPSEAAVPMTTSASPTTQEVATSIKRGCIPCSMGHFLTCTGLLNEAMRFARKEGLGSDQVLEDTMMCVQELNAMERVDLRPEKIAALPPWEKELALKALDLSKETRLGLESMQTADDLERIAANLQPHQMEIVKEWTRKKLAMVTPKKN